MLLTENNYKRQTFIRVSRMCLFAKRYLSAKNITMRKIIYIITLLVLTSCGESNSKQKNAEIPIRTSTENTEKIDGMKDNSLELEVQKDSIDKENSYNPEEYRQFKLKTEYEKAKLYSLTDTIKADLNGDGVMDKAIFIKQNETSGIVIIHGKTNENIRIGFGKTFSHIIEFDWVDYWGLVEDKHTFETTFDESGDVLGGKEISIQNPSIALGANESGGGLITFMNGKYVWIHQSC